MRGQALITGATGGLGRALAHAFAARDYDLFLLGQSPVKLERLQQEVAGYPISVKTAVCDLGRADDIRDLFVQTSGQLEGLSVLVNAAGISRGARVEALTEVDWNASLAINLTAPFLISQHCVPYLRRSRNASIINISSMAGVVGASKPSYAASKAGLIGLTKSLAGNLAPLGIRVNCIVPGAVDTEMISDWNEAKRSQIACGTFIGRIADPAEIANIALFLASPEASYVSGICFNATGGACPGPT